MFLEWFKQGFCSHGNTKRKGIVSCTACAFAEIRAEMKTTTNRDHLFEQMKNRAFFDAYMDEPCPGCADRNAWKARAEKLAEALGRLVEDFHGYPAAERPCYAMDKAEEALAAFKAALGEAGK